VLQNIVGRPALTTATTAATTTGTITSTVSTVVNTTNSLRVATASQLNRQQSKLPAAYPPNKPNADLKIIDLTDEEDRAKTSKYFP
jgi:hypothetical protein